MRALHQGLKAVIKSTTQSSITAAHMGEQPQRRTSRQSELTLKIRGLNSANW